MLERWFEDQVFGGVTSDKQLWKDNEIAMGFFGLFKGVAGQFFIAFDVPDRGVELSKGYAQIMCCFMDHK